MAPLTQRHRTPRNTHATTAPEAPAAPPAYLNTTQRLEAEIARVNAELLHLRAQVATYVGTYGDRRFDCGQLTADRIVIPGPDGKPAIVLGINSEGPAISMRHGEVGLEMALSDSMSAITLRHGPDQEEAVSLQVMRDELLGGKWVPRIEVWRGDSGVNLGFVDDTPSLSITQHDMLMFDLCSNVDESGAVMRFHDSKEKRRMRVGLGTDGTPEVACLDRNQNRLVSLGVNTEGPFIHLDQADGFVALNVDSEGAPALLLAHGGDAEPSVHVQVNRDVHGLWLPAVDVSSGGCQAKLQIDHMGPSLSMMRDEVHMFDLLTNPDESGMAMHFDDSNEKDRLSIGLGEEGAPMATFLNRSENPLIRIGLEPNGDLAAADTPFKPGVISATIDAHDASKHARALDSLAQTLEDSVYTMDSLRLLKTRVKAVFRARQAEIENGGQQ